ncbi:hypothetical protein GQ42DRAFT_66308 [Ramicandelaber brevisporus]|nr:hypothetical protein GQ42DRAFT_66308 [Ramicandelaber brevisporus]
MVQWQTWTLPDGRVYYHDTIGQTSRWDTPSNLLAEEDQLPPSWASFIGAGGYRFYVNTSTGEKTWERPQQQQQSSVEPSQPELQHQAQNRQQQKQPQQQPDQYEWEINSDDEDLPPLPTSLDFATKADAEAAFILLLRHSKVDSGWAWDDVMRTLINHPMYQKSLTSAPERRDAFQKFLVEQRKREQVASQRRSEKLKNAVWRLLEDDGNGDKNEAVVECTSWKRVVLSLRTNAKFAAMIKNERDSKVVHEAFLEHLQRAKQKRLDTLGSDREMAKSKFRELLKSITTLVADTKWDDARDFVKSTPQYKNEPIYSCLDDLAMLEVYSEYVINELEIPENERFEQLAADERQRARRARKEFGELLDSLSVWKPYTAWSDVFPLIKDDIRFSRLIACNIREENEDCSTPLDLVRDRIAPLRIELDQLVDHIAAQFGSTVATVDADMLEKAQQECNIETSHLELTDAKLILYAQLLLDKKRNAYVEQQQSVRELSDGEIEEGEI